MGTTPNTTGLEDPEQVSVIYLGELTRNRFVSVCCIVVSQLYLGLFNVP